MSRAWLISLALLLLLTGSVRAAPSLPSWREGPTKRALLHFVEETTTKGSPRYLAPAERIAVFDTDGTLWSEKPLYFQAMFVLDRLRELAPKHPEWRHTEPYRAALTADREALAALDHKSLLELLATTHAGMTSDEFSALVRHWLQTARDSRFHRPYTELVFQPMIELLQFLRANQFRTFIVSGGGVAFMRTFAEETYGIPPWQVVGSRIALKYELRAQGPVLVRLPKITFIDDGAGKPVGIQQMIGARPVFAAGNSDGDIEMLEWTTMDRGPRLGLLVHHTDGSREWAYDRKSPVGQLARGLDEAKRRGWLVVDMKRDWSRVYAFQPMTE